MNYNKSLEQAREISADKRAKNQYLDMWIPCCFTCKHSEQPPEEVLRCKLLSDDEWVVGSVYELGFCNKYEIVVP